MPRTPHLPATGVYAYQVVFIRGFGKDLSIKLWWTGASAPGVGYNPDAACTAFLASYSTTLTAALSHNVIIIGQKLSVRSALMQWSGTNYSAITGGESADALPDDVNVVLRRITDSPGASARGRLRIPGVPVSFVSENNVNPTGASAYILLCTALKAPVTDQGITWSPANFSPKTGALHAAIDFKLTGLVGTQRRRRPRF